MNREAAQEAINNIVDTYRSEQPQRARKQYPASKKYLVEAEELGILDMIPNAYSERTPGNTEIQLILAAAKDDGAVSGVTPEGEGDEAHGAGSALYQALNASDASDADEAVDRYDENTDVSLTTVNAADGHHRYDVAEFLLGVDAITLQQFEDNELPPVNVYVVEDPQIIEMFLDVDAALGLYNAQVAVYSD